MNVTVTEFRDNLTKWLEIAKTQEIFITKNGKRIALLTTPERNALKVVNILTNVLRENKLGEDPLADEDSDRQ